MELSGILDVIQRLLKKRRAGIMLNQWPITAILAGVERQGGRRHKTVRSTWKSDRGLVRENNEDIYMPDFKYGDSETAFFLSGTPHYYETARDATKEMYRQVGDLVMDERGIAVRGLLVRHLVLPEGLAGTRRVMQFIASEISPDTYVNIMGQYRPCFQASAPPMNRRITASEFHEAVAIEP